MPSQTNVIISVLAAVVVRVGAVPPDHLTEAGQVTVPAAPLAGCFKIRIYLAPSLGLAKVKVCAPDANCIYCTFALFQSRVVVVVYLAEKYCLYFLMPKASRVAVIS